MMGIVPYTIVVMGTTNRKLMEMESKVREVNVLEEKIEEKKVASPETAHSLMDWWGVLNLGRGAMLVVSGVLGLWTSLN